MTLAAGSAVFSHSEELEDPNAGTGTGVAHSCFLAQFNKNYVILV